MQGDLTGHVLKDRYKLIDERGRGNFAVVYVARDLENNKIYAIKVMHLELSDDDDLLARFQREAHILLRLNDAHLVRIVDYGDERGMHYIVMDYVDGQNLRYHMHNNNGPMDALRALNYAHQITEGLDAAYRQGVVHRDIKPQNILVNSGDVIKITDFGLARSRETVTLTQSNVFMGTPYYISPEQADSGRSADTRSDLYSVAAVLFEMLAGRPPYQGETAVDIVIKHHNEKVPSICRLRPSLPLEMDQFMQKALAKQPEERYATPQEFMAALDRLQESIQAALPEKRPSSVGVAGPEPKVGAAAQGVQGQVSLGKAHPVAQKDARLVVLSNGEIIPLRGELMIVGRKDPTLGIYPEISLADKTVGRRHANLRNQHGTYTVEDLNALNKTRLNGVILMPNEEHVLKDGDVLRFGSVEVRFEL